MADETGGMGFDGLNSWWEVREDTNKVTEEAVRRIQDDQKKAQHIGQEIKKDKANNDKLAKFLTFLLKEIKNDTIIRQLYTVFFKTRHPETELLHLRTNINTIVIVGIFVPFYQAETKQLGLEWIYEDIFAFDGSNDLTKYIKYIKQLLPKFHDNIDMEKHEFTKLLTHIGEYFHLTEKLSTETAIEFEDTIKKELYN